MERAIETRSSNEREVGDVPLGGGTDDGLDLKDRGGSRVIALVRSREFGFLDPAAPTEDSDSDPPEADGKFSFGEDEAGGHLSRTGFFRSGGETSFDRSS